MVGEPISGKVPHEVFLRGLEDRMVGYKDLVGIPVQENGEGFVSLTRLGIPNGYLPFRADMATITGPEVIVREGVGERLLTAQRLLQARNPDRSLYAVYGYRSLEVQTERFESILQHVPVAEFPNKDDRYELVHRISAVPEVAGHPSGGGIDVFVQDNITSEFVDFGFGQEDIGTKKAYTFYPGLEDQAVANRMELREDMLEAGFAPFDGEFWHFAYGDKEWAHYYRKPHAIYGQKSVHDPSLATFVLPNL